jgi:urease accessory protein
LSATALRSLMRLQSWLSPAFPVGAFSYSHALEWAVEAGWVTDRASLVAWLDADLRHGAGRADAILFAHAFRAVNDPEGFIEVAALAAALRGTAELALESTAQGTAFLATLRRAWPDAALDDSAALLAERDIAPTLAVVAGVAAALDGAPLDAAIALFVQATTANLVGAGVRLVPLGQTDGQRAVAALEDAVLATAAEAAGAGLDEVGSAALMVDIASARHETQYTRLFRS